MIIIGRGAILATTSAGSRPAAVLSAPHHCWCGANRWLDSRRFRISNLTSPIQIPLPEPPAGAPRARSPKVPGIPGAFIGGAWHPAMTLPSTSWRRAWHPLGKRFEKRATLNSVAPPRHGDGDEPSKGPNWRDCAILCALWQICVRGRRQQWKSGSWVWHRVASRRSSVC